MCVCVREWNSLGSLGSLGFLGDKGIMWSLGSVDGFVSFGNSLGSLCRGSGYVGAVNSLGYLV